MDKFVDRQSIVVLGRELCVENEGMRRPSAAETERCFRITGVPKSMQRQIWRRYRQSVWDGSPFDVLEAYHAIIGKTPIDEAAA